MPNLSTRCSEQTMSLERLPGRRCHHRQRSVAITSWRRRTVGTPEGVPRQLHRPPVKEAGVTSGCMRGEPDAREGSEPVPLSGRRCPLQTRSSPPARQKDRARSRRNRRGPWPAWLPREPRRLPARARWLGHPKAPSPNPRRSSRPSRRIAPSAARPATSVHATR